MNDSHLHTDPTSQTEIDYPGTRRDCPICQVKAAEAADKAPVAKKGSPKPE